MNKQLFLLSALTITLASCGGDKASSNAENDTVKSTEATTTIDKKAEVESAKKITKAFGGALKAELQKAMKSGGPIKALAVCNKKAMPITAQVAKDQGVQLSRVSLKNRNPANTPNKWQTEVLNDFNKRAAAGEDIAKMGFANIVDNNGKKQLHFMKALPTGKVCLACHGSEIAGNVKEKLAELYPQDKATGYSLGQVRGAIVVVKDLN